jgi:cobalt/nickel transport system permease protein
MFADGGLAALGANVFNMAIVSVCSGYFVFRTMKRLLRMEPTRATVFAAAFAAWCGTVLASISCAGELAFSKTVPWALAFPAMANIHMLIGIGEGLATGLIALTVLRARPELMAGTHESGKAAGFSFVGYGLIVSIGLAVFVAPFACPWPDGLDAVAKALGFSGRTQAPVVPAPLSDYRLPFIGSTTLATAVAGLIGTLLAFIAAYALARVLVPAFRGGTRPATVSAGDSSPTPKV